MHHYEGDHERRIEYYHGILRNNAEVNTFVLCNGSSTEIIVNSRTNENPRWIQFIRNNFSGHLEDLPQSNHHRFHFQQDVAPSHNSGLSTI